ncbi:CreA family protein [Oceanospirillum sanctuarii]|uniref:CreA family protein n=1 Tax=Oceanospirillum sanctuarii TaxID=1434821 RepID=UPI000A3CE7E8|nr:CreA family protein [Oceanospirillum sanctuarii]
MRNYFSGINFTGILIALGMVFSLSVKAEEIGSVSTVFKMLGPNHKIVIEAFDDPDISGVSCWLARAKTGGISGGLGLAEDPSDGSIACRQVGPIKLPDDLEDGEKVFNKRTSLVFKTLQVVRFYDERRHTLIYLVYSDKVIEGSPKNSISVVPIQNNF